MLIIRKLRRQPCIYIVLLALILTFALAACGTGTAHGQGTGSSGNSGNTTIASGTSTLAPVSTSTTSTSSTVQSGAQTPTTSTQGLGTDNGCPSNVVVGGAPAANVILHSKDAANPTTAHIGNIIEFQLPFGQKWSGPLKSQDNLALQSPFGYASSTNHSCVWRFIAKNAGTTQVSFYGQMLCKPGSICAQYVFTTTFTVTVQ